MKKISIVTLGCKVNQYESEEIAEQLEQLRSLVQSTLAANQAANKNRGGK